MNTSNTEALRGLAGFLAAEGIAAATDEKNYGMAGNHYENAKAMARRRSIDGHLKFVQSLLTTPTASDCLTPAGFVLVPKEPTEVWAAAVTKALSLHNAGYGRAVIREVLAVAPAAEVEEYNRRNDGPAFRIETVAPAVVVDEKLVIQACNAYDQSREDGGPAEYVGMHAALTAALSHGKEVGRD